jgi:hypothetical protein
MNYLLNAAVGFTEAPRSSEPSRTMQQLFAPQPTQVAAKEVVRSSPSCSQDAALAEADRKLAAGESLFESTCRSSSSRG